MATVFAVGIEIDNQDDTPRWGLTIIERTEEQERASFVVHRTKEEPFNGTPEDTAANVQKQIAEDPFTARSSVIVRVDHEAGEALADALNDLGLRPVRVRVRTDAQGATPGAEGEAVLDAREEAVALSEAHRTGTLRFDHRSTEGTANLARRLSLMVDDTDDGQPQVKADDLQVQGISALLAHWWVTEQVTDPTERLRADLPGTEQAI